MTGATTLKRVAHLRAGGTPAVDDPMLWDDNGGVEWVSIGDMTRSPIVTNGTRRVSHRGMAEKRLPVGAPGTVLFAMYASLGAVAVLGVEATWNQAILGVQGRDGVAHNSFIAYWLEHLARDVSALARSNTQDNLNAEQVGNLPFPALAIEDQRRVADFLDVETARIDALIEKKRRMIALLATRRAVVMSAGIAGQGLDHPRRLSELAWLEDLPLHWQETKLTHVARLGSGHTPSRDHPEWWENCTIPWVTTGEVSQMRADRIEVIAETREMISELGLANSSAELHQTGTVVLCRTAASAGYSAILGTPMATSQDFATWTCGPRLRPRFLLLCLRVMRRDLLERLAMGSTHKTIYMPDIEGIRIPLPKVQEQDEIVDAIWLKLRSIDAAIDILSLQIGLFGERRQALVTAAVTGDLDIGETVA